MSILFVGMRNFWGREDIAVRVFLTCVTMVLISRAALGADADASFDAWTASKGQWKTRNHVYCQNVTETDCRSFCGLNGWTDYVYEVQARKVAGAEGFLVLFRVKDASSFYWWNIGGWSNRQHGLETRGEPVLLFPGSTAGLKPVSGMISRSW